MSFPFGYKTYPKVKELAGIVKCFASKISTVDLFSQDGKNVKSFGALAIRLSYATEVLLLQKNQFLVT